MAEGSLGGVTVFEELRGWGKAETVEFTIDEADATAGQTVAVDLTICDDTGTPVRDWNGNIKVDVDGDARLFRFNDAGEVLVARGDGRAYLEVGPSGGEIVIHATADGLESGTITIEPRQ